MDHYLEWFIRTILYAKMCPFCDKMINDTMSKFQKEGITIGLSKKHTISKVVCDRKNFSKEITNMGS